MSLTLYRAACIRVHIQLFEEDWNEIAREVCDLVMSTKAYEPLGTVQPIRWSEA